jgi:hypothetical protein
MSAVHQTELIDSCAQPSSNRNQSADDSVMNRPPPIPRRSLWEQTFFRDGNRYTQNDAPLVPDHEKTGSDEKLSPQEDTTPYSGQSDHQSFDQPVTLIASSPTCSDSLASDCSFVTCTDRISQQEEVTTSFVPCASTSRSSSRRRARRLAIRAQVDEILSQVRNTHASSLAKADTFAGTAPFETNSSPQQDLGSTTGSDESNHQHTDTGSRLSQKSSVYSRGTAYPRSIWTRATGRLGKYRDEVGNNGTGSIWHRSQFRSRNNPTTLTGLSNVGRLILSKWQTHLPTKFTRTRAVHY